LGTYIFEKTIECIANEYKIDMFVYFGSYGTEYFHSESDIDIAFLSSENMSCKEKVKLLEDLIKYHRKTEIDLVDLKAADPLLCFEIASNGRVLYEKQEGLFDRYSLFCFKKYYELRPIIEQQLESVAAQVRSVLKNA
jgi:predicted nucleotidyltransferase